MWRVGGEGRCQSYRRISTLVTTLCTLLPTPSKLYSSTAMSIVFSKISHINWWPKTRYQYAAWIWCNAHLGTPRPVADVAMLEMQWFISISMRKIWWFIFQSKSLQLHSSKLNVGRGWEASARSPDGEWAEKFRPKLFLSPLDALMHCIECMRRALRPQARYYTSMHSLALPARRPPLSRAALGAAPGLHWVAIRWGVGSRQH